METVQLFLTVLIWFLCPILILLILVQGGAGDLSSTFGGGGQLDSTLGVGASRKMGKLTGWLSFTFLLIVLVMAVPEGGSIEASAPAALGDDDAQLDAPEGEQTPGFDLEDAAAEGAFETMVEDAPPAEPVPVEPAEDQPEAEAEGATEPVEDAGLEIDVDAGDDGAE